MVQMGTYKELLISSPSFSRLLDNIHQQEQEQPNDVHGKVNNQCMPLSENENEEEQQLLASQDLETKERGSVKGRVYLDYLRAGAGLVFGLILLISVFSTRETIVIFAAWWLAEWSEDEGHRHRLFNNCTETGNTKMNTIRSMNDVDWNDHRNKRFYYYCGM
jgi:hypothetical protein